MVLWKDRENVGVVERRENNVGVAGRREKIFPTRMVYLHYISCLRYTILVGNPRNVGVVRRRENNVGVAGRREKMLVLLVA